MSAIKRAWNRALTILRRSELDDDFDEEARSHIALATEDYVRDGMSRAEAERLARLKFGSAAASKDAHRDSRGFTWVDALWFDSRLAVRGLLRDRGFAVTGITTLTIALALNVVVATLADAMLFRGLPQATRSERLLYLGMRKPTDPACCSSPIRYEDFEVWRARTRTFEGMAFGRNEAATFRDADNRLSDLMVSRRSVNTFSLLGIQPVIGRDFSTDDETAGAPAVAIISHAFWERRFNHRADIAGLPVTINGRPASIVGVLPEHFALVYEQDVFMPLTPASGIEGGVFGRLRDGATQAEARAELEAITQQLEASDSTKRGLPEVSTYTQAYVAPDAPMIYGALWVGACFVLLIACANLTNLTLVRTIGRWREFSTRIALGAGAPRMVRQMLIEQLALAAVSTMIAWPLITWAVRRWAEATASPYLALDYSVNMNTRLYLIAVAIGTAVLTALLPIGRVMQIGVHESLKGDARGVTQGLRGKRLTTVLVGVQMALAMVLLLGAGVLVRSFENIVGADTGVRDAGRVMTGVIGLPSDRYPTPDARVAFFVRLEERLRTMGGTEAVSFASTFPPRTVRPRQIEIDGRPSSTIDGDTTQVITAGPDYFTAMGRPTIVGRDFNALDDRSAAPVVMVNESFVARFWPGARPIGKRLRTIDAGVPGPWRTVVGITPNIMQGDATRQLFKPVVYIPLRQQPLARGFVFVRSSVAPTQTMQAVLAEVQRLDSSVITEQFGSLHAKFAFDRDFMDLEHADLAKHAAIAPAFAVVALVVAGIGLVAVIAHSVSQRTKEIGVRMAIGAAGRDIARMILREGMMPVAIGLFAGLLAAVGTNRILQTQLVGVSPYDPLTMIAGPAILIAVALIGCRIPTRRAVRVDPVLALRHE